MSCAKDARAACRALQRRPDWSYLGMTGTGHYKLQHVSGEVLILPSTPSEMRWLRNHRAMVRRIERGWEGVRRYASAEKWQLS